MLPGEDHCGCRRFDVYPGHHHPLDVDRSLEEFFNRQRTELKVAMGVDPE